MKKLVLLVLLVLVGLSHPLYAGEALVNSDVEVDVNGKDAADARAQAMTRAQADALANLLSKLTTAERVQQIMSGLDTDKIASIVRGTEILEEKMSSNRYRAHLLITFDGDEISKLIGTGQTADGKDMPEITGSFLIIPAYEEDGSNMLWDDGNPWLDTWRNMALDTTSGDIVVPFGDGNDAALINVKNASTVSYDMLAPMTVRYGVSDIVVLSAKFSRIPDMVLAVTRRRLNRVMNDASVLTFRADPQETKDMLMHRAAHDIVESLQHKKVEELETAKLTHGGNRSSIMMVATISTLASWTELREKLSKLPMIDRLETVAISPQQIDMVVYYRGSPDSLADAITAQNLRLVKKEQFWVVSRD